MQDIRTDHATGLPVLPDDGTGQRRLLALLPPTHALGLDNYRDVHPLVPRDQWREIRLLDAYNPPVLDQGQHGSCVGHGACTTFSLAWLAQGEPLVRFSACYIYGQVNGGRDQGANISDTIDALMRKGVCLESTVPEGMIYASRFPRTADAEAANYKLIDAYRVSSFEEVASAIQMGYAVADSVMVGRRFNDWDANGLVGVDRGPGNHCVCKGGMTKIGGTWYLCNQNSWTESWGIKGRFLTGEAHIEAQNYYEGVVYRLVSHGPNAPPPPPTR